MSVKFRFVECDIDGEGKRWRLAVDAGKHLAFADVDFSAPKSEFRKRGDRVVGPFTVEELLSAIANRKTIEIKKPARESHLKS